MCPTLCPPPPTHPHTHIPPTTYPPTHTHTTYHFPYTFHSTHPLTTHFQTKGTTGGIQPAAEGALSMCWEGVPPWRQHSEGGTGDLSTHSNLMANENSYINTAISHYFSSHEPYMTVTWLSHEPHRQSIACDCYILSPKVQDTHFGPH